MATYQITSPDGKTYELEGPEGATQEELIAQIPKEEKGINWPRMGAEFLGGIVGGFGGAPGGPLGAIAGAGLGAEGGGQMYDLSEKYIGGGDPEPTGLMGAAKNVGVNMLGQKIGGDVINYGGRQISKMLNPAANRLMGGGAPETITAFQNAGLRNPSAGMVSGNRWLQSMEEGLSKAPGSANYMREYTDSMLAGMGDEASRIAQLSGGRRLSQQGAGDVLSGGAGGSMARFGERRGLLEDALVSRIGKDTPVDMGGTRGLMETLQADKAVAPGARRFMDPAIGESKKILEVTEDLPLGISDLPYEAVRQARTDLGGRLETPSVAGGYVGLEGQQAKKVYGALLDDLNVAAKEQGALQQSRILDRYTRYYNRVDKPTLEMLIKRDDKAYKWMMEGSKDSGARIAKVRNNVTSGEWDDVVSTTIDRMGSATPGAQNMSGDLFSPNTFVTNWNKLAPEAKSSMFGGKKYKELRASLDNLGKVAEVVKDSGAVRNYSNTAAISGVLNALSNPVTAMSLGTAVIPQRIIAKNMTNPVFVNWLARGAKIDPADMNALSVHMARMPTLIGYELTQDQ